MMESRRKLAFFVIAQVESNGDPDAYNQLEQAVGIVQIRPIVIRDLEGFTLKDRWCPEVSYEIFTAYMNKYGASTIEDHARLWNGGPTRRGTDNYWERVHEEIRVLKSIESE